MHVLYFTTAPGSNGRSMNRLPIATLGRKVLSVHGNQIWFGGFGSEGLGYCVAQAPSPYGAPFGVSRDIIWNQNNRPQGDAFYVPYNWYLYPAATHIQNLQSR
jgi:hypothetical protein